ncbi:MAG TPA: hypothetical protein VK742_20310 [Candidatus Sulfotelmatobacter sp.]|jgi:hypothetical protein|nr:hypothetical protein [Candidatus Sulfotelmatobacter sp.]
MPTISIKTLLPREIQLAWDMRGSRQLALGDLNAASRESGLSNERIMELIQLRLVVAFNIATNPDGERPEYRVLIRSLIFLIESNYVRQMDRENWDPIFRLIFPYKLAGKPKALAGTEVASGLNCTRQHVSALSATGCFSIINEAKQGRGNTGSFTTASVEAWLKSRML